MNSHIMNAGWAYVPASDYCDKVTDGTHDSPKRSEQGKSLVTSKHIKGSSIDFNSTYLISTEDFNKINERSKVDQWDVIISMIGEYCGFCYVEKNPIVEYAVKNVGMFKVGDRLKALWLYYYLNSGIGKDELNNNRAGTSQPYLTLGSLRNLPILVPDRKETMENVVAILSALDDKIELNRQTNATLETIAQAIFKEWFVDFNFPSTLVGAGSKPALKRSIPEGWHVGTLTDMIELNPKTSLKKGEIAKYVEMKDLSTGNASINSFIEREFSSGSKFQQGDTLLARITPCLENGKTCFVDFLEKDESGWGSTEFIVMRGQGFVSPYFVYCLAKQQSFREFAIQSMVGSSGRQRVVESILADFPIIIPDELTMAKYHSIAESIFRKIKECAYQSRILVQIRDNLLPKLMNGEIDVRERAGLEPAPMTTMVSMPYEPTLTVNMHGHHEQ